MSEPDLRAAALRGKFYGHDRFRAPGGGRQPSQLNQSIALQAKEAPIMRVALSFKLSFKVEDSVDLASHQNRARHGKPAVELFRPGAKDRCGRSGHRLFDGEL